MSAVVSATRPSAKFTRDPKCVPYSDSCLAYVEKQFGFSIDEAKVFLFFGQSYLRRTKFTYAFGDMFDAYCSFGQFGYVTTSKWGTVDPHMTVHQWILEQIQDMEFIDDEAVLASFTEEQLNAKMTYPFFEEFNERVHKEAAWNCEERS